MSFKANLAFIYGLPRIKRKRRWVLKPKKKKMSRQLYFLRRFQEYAEWQGVVFGTIKTPSLFIGSVIVSDPSFVTLEKTYLALIYRQFTLCWGWSLYLSTVGPFVLGTKTTKRDLLF
jgi:hypothetical protein